MIKKALIGCFMVLFVHAHGQKKEFQVPMTAEAWEHDAEKVEFITHRSVPAVRPKTGEGFQITLKDYEFSSGTIEYDVEFTGRGFPGIGFRSSQNQKESELFYIRYFGTVDPLSRYTLQYATIIDGVNLWDLTDDYQAAAQIRDNGWNHVKLVVSDRQMKVYVNDMENVALHVPVLEGTMASGGIYLTGSVIYANLTITPGMVQNLPHSDGYPLLDSDTRYIKNWEVSAPVDLPFSRDIVKGVPRSPGVVIDSTLMDNDSWQALQAEHRNMVNLTRKFGATENGKRRLVWLRTTITSEMDQVRNLKLGFSDEVWVFIDGQPLYIDKNYYGSPGMKQPRGRCSIENSELQLPLKKGDNELLIGVAHYFFGWGLIARLDATDGLQF